MDIVIVGAGASGLLAAYAASKNQNNNIVLLEKNEKIGKKIYITGKGRCNITNLTTNQLFLSNVVTNPKFLYSSLNNFSPRDTIEFFKQHNLKCKVERGNRVFPVSDKSSDVIKALGRAIDKKNIQLKLNENVKDIKRENDKFVVFTDKQKYIADKLILSTGGCSYQGTGSTGDGYKFLEKLGHTIKPLTGGLVGLHLKKEKYFEQLQGVSLKNVSCKIVKNNKILNEEFGEMLFTHKGVSGPIILTQSSKVKDFKNTKLLIDLKPALSIEQLDKRVLRDFDANSNKNIENALKGLLLNSLILPVLLQSKIEPTKKVNVITKIEREELVKTIKNLSFDILEKEDINRAVVTKGGVNVKEINPKTLESKIFNNLYITGELLDIDALTGGFNLQVAFSTGYLAGISTI